MTLPESLAALLLLPLLLACLWRARLLALAILPPLVLALAQWLELPGLESASHPSRWITCVVCAGLAGFAAYSRHWAWYAYFGNARGKTDCQCSGCANLRERRVVNIRALIASLLVLGSCAPDLLALHPFFWARFAEWPLVPIQIAVEATVIAVLLAPERWVAKCLR
jgi:hypothetical protein